MGKDEIAATLPTSYNVRGLKITALNAGGPWKVVMESSKQTLCVESRLDEVTAKSKAAIIAGMIRDLVDSLDE